MDGAAMPSILFLCHRLPWPPSKGDKIRSYHILRQLAEHHRVYLGTFVDDPADWRYLAPVAALCEDVCVRPLSAWRKGVRASGSLLRGEPLTVGCYRDRALQRWVDSLCAAHKIDLVLCCSSGVAPLVMRHGELPRVMDFVDADSGKWQQYAGTARGVMRMVYRREARQLAAFERIVAAQFDASLFVSDAEAAFFRRQQRATAGKVYSVANGVDGGYWDPQRGYPNPYHADVRAVTFVGAMDYRANVDAAQWFAHAVWPRIRAWRADARFYIVGSNPTAAVRALAAQPGVVVTGGVDDVRPYVAHAHAIAAPLRVARGIQNKVLEALAMEKVLLATPAAWEGIEDFAGRRGCISTSSAAMAWHALRWLGVAQPARVPPARAHVLARYDWPRNLQAYEELLRAAQRSAALACVTRAAGREVCA
jgi:sugar transferase (PEP-CTERM/EpsH1 system associated)